MTMRSLLISATLAGGLLVAAELSAQAPASSAEARGPAGLFLGASFTGSFVTVDGATLGGRTFDDRGREGGGGMHFTVGYAFSPAISVVVRGGGVLLNEEEERMLGGMELALRHGFVTTSRSLRPYLEMGLGGSALEHGTRARGTEFAGGSLSVAGGFDYFVTRQVALNADFGYTMGMFTTVSVDDRTIADDARLGFSSSRVNLGVSWYPMAGGRAAR